MKGLLIYSLVVVAMLFLSACGLAPQSTETPSEPQSIPQSEIQQETQSNFQADYDWVLPYFNFVNQDNERVSKEDLEGQVWLANFIFTNCYTVCPPMTANMAKLQQTMADENVSVQIVSFSVDPDRDTPEALKEYASKFDANFTNWHLLTGYRQGEIKKIAKAFKTLAEAEEGTDQFIHSTKIFMIDENGIIVKGYNGLQVPYDQIIADLKLKQEDGSLASIK